MSDITSIGMHSLLAFQAALTVSSQNIANVNTPYYSRHEVDFAQAFGSGVEISNVRRLYDFHQSQNLQQKNSAFAKMDVYLQRISNFESLLDDSTNNISRYTNDSLDALRQLNGNVGSIDSRSVYLNKLTNLTHRFNDISNEIYRQKDNINKSLQSNVDSSNEILTEIASINHQVSSSQGEDQSALLDERERLVQNLAKYFDFTTRLDTQGVLNVYVGNGLQIVNGNDAASLTTIPDPENSANIQIMIKSGTHLTPINNFIQSGQMAGLIQFGQKGLDVASRSLDRLALVMAEVFNNQSKLGVDLNGDLGGNVFNDINSANLMARRTLANGNNAGSCDMTVNIDNARQLTTSDYRLRFDSTTHYVLTRINDNTVVGSGTISTLPQTISADGFSLNLASGGTFVAEDSFIISPTKNASSDMAMIITDAAKLALGLPVVAEANQQNTGKGISQVTSVDDTTNSAFSIAKQLNPPIKVEFLSPTSYRLVNAIDSSVLEGPLAYDPIDAAKNPVNIFPTPGGYNPGYKVTLTGDIKTGDTFNIAYNTNPRGDNRNGKLLADLYQKKLIENDTLTFTNSYDAVSHDISVKTTGAQAGYESSSSLLKQAEVTYNELSGVNLEQEAINLTRYQQAYQASAQILEAAKTMFDIIVNLARR